MIINLFVAVFNGLIAGYCVSIEWYGWAAINAVLGLVNFLFWSLNQLDV